MCDGKVTSQNRLAASSVQRKDSALSLIAALLGPLFVVFTTGYLLIQLELSQAGAPLLDFNARPVPATGAWVQYAVRAGLVLLGLAAVLGYRFVSRTMASRVLILVVLTVAASVGAYTLRTFPTDGEPLPIPLVSLMHGAESPFILALIGAALAGLRRNVGRR